MVLSIHSVDFVLIWWRQVNQHDWRMLSSEGCLPVSCCHSYSSFAGVRFSREHYALLLIWTISYFCSIVVCPYPSPVFPRLSPIFLPAPNPLLSFSHQFCWLTCWARSRWTHYWQLWYLTLTSTIVGWLCRPGDVPFSWSSCLILGPG